jgi:sporulation protein YlmC with PRC-barrel domain
MRKHKCRSVYPLARLPTHRIAPGEPDIRGWLVIAADGRRLGRITDVLIDLDTLAAEHLAVRLDRGIASQLDRATVVLPLESGQAAAVRPHVHLRRTTTHDLAGLPAVDGDALESHDEHRLRAFFKCDKEPGAAAHGFWSRRRRERATLPYVAPVPVEPDRFDAYADWARVPLHA